MRNKRQRPSSQTDYSGLDSSEHSSVAVSASEYDVGKRDGPATAILGLLQGECIRGKVPGGERRISICISVIAKTIPGTRVLPDEAAGLGIAGQNPVGRGRRGIKERVFLRETAEAGLALSPYEIAAGVDDSNRSHGRRTN